MTPLERLLLEAIPTRPAPAPDAPRQTELTRHWTQAEQDAHWGQLCDEVGTPGAPRPARLHLVTDAACPPIRLHHPPRTPPPPATKGTP